MTWKYVHDYLTVRLNESVRNERLVAFMTRPDIVELVDQMEDLENEFMARWKAEIVPELQDPAHAVDPNLSPPSNEVQQEIQAKLPEAPLSPPQPITHPDETTEPMQFAPTPDSQLPAGRTFKKISLPNATVGKPYRFALNFKLMGLADIVDSALVVDPATGLTYDAETTTISGTALLAGEFDFALTYRLPTTEPDRPRLSQPLTLLINPDPRSLWKNLPSDVQDPYYKPDSDQGLVSRGDTRLLAASVRGRSHAHEGKFRDDDFSIEYLPEVDWYLVSVADGAGSAPYARRGAQLACQMVTGYLKTQVVAERWSQLETGINQYSQQQQEPVAAANVKRQLYDILGQAVFAAYKAIEREAQVKEAALKDYATTLITVLAKPVAGGWFVGAFWVGDGGVGIYQADAEPILLGAPDGGEYAGQTRFLTMPDTITTNFYDRFRFAFVPDFTAVILMTDGVTDPKFQTDNNLGRKEVWDALWAELQQSVSFDDAQTAPAQLQDWLGFWSPGNHDDRTIAFLYNHAGDPKN